MRMTKAPFLPSKCLITTLSPMADIHRNHERNNMNACQNPFSSEQITTCMFLLCLSGPSNTNKPSSSKRCIQ